jgi:hypothetical protein
VAACQLIRIAAIFDPVAIVAIDLRASIRAVFAAGFSDVLVRQHTNSDAYATPRGDFVHGRRGDRLSSPNLPAAPKVTRSNSTGRDHRVERPHRGHLSPCSGREFGVGIVDSIRYPALRVTRRYCWIVSRSFSESRYSQNHLMALGVEIRRDADAEPTSTRLDSAFRVATVDVTEAAGEPPMGIRSVAPVRASVTMRDVRVHVVVESRDATRALLPPAGNTATLP